MIYNRDCNNYYIELLHLLTDKDLSMCLFDKRKLDNKVISLVKLLRDIKEKSDRGL